jgi:phospho-N-acetylmuramoyl-pentapeptide-transferase
MTAPSLTTLLWQVAAGFGVALAAGAFLLAVLPRLQFRQTAYEDAPKTHQKKTGTPTMGGIAILAAVAVAGLIARNDATRALLVLVFGCALVGFVDDILGVRSGRNAGLRARTKLLATALVGVIFLRMASDAGFGDTIFHTQHAALAVPHWAWIVLGILAITGTVHAVNLTDGLDGLAAGAVIPPLYVCAIPTVAVGLQGGAWTTVLSFAIGGCLGFLVYNRYPARIFMGDTGSLPLGALLAGAAILDGQMLLLLVIGGLFVAEALSVILQVTYYKATGGRRIFLMSPLHHHFELAGWPERTVTLRFWLASTICSVLGWIIVHV